MERFCTDEAALVDFVAKNIRHNVYLLVFTMHMHDNAATAHLADMCTRVFHLSIEVTLILQHSAISQYLHPNIAVYWTSEGYKAFRFSAALALPRDPRYNGFLKFPKLPEKAKDAASFAYSNADNFSSSVGLRPLTGDQGLCP